MSALKLSVILLTIPLTLQAQELPPDTISLTDTIPFGIFMLKNSAELTYETQVDTANTLVINELLASNSETLLDEYGDDDDWFELYNYGDVPVRLNDLYFTDDDDEPLKWKLDPAVDTVLNPDDYFLIWADGEPEEGFNHATFKLSAEGEYLALFTGDGTLIDQRFYGSQTTNISYGRFPDAGLTWNFFTEPTPGAPNNTAGETSVLPAPISNLTGGIYSGPVTLSLYSTVVGADIYYTTDCTEPDGSGSLYLGPVLISESTIVRARLMKEGALDGPDLTISILMDQPAYENPVVSLVAEPDALFGSSGLISANNSAVEISASLEYMEDGATCYRGGAGIQLHSPSQAKPYSLRMFARSRYGNGWFEYPFFNEAAPDQYKRLILRNSGNDNINKAPTNIHFRDPLIQTIGKQSNRNAMISQSKPVNVYLNGKYHGLFNLREREDRYYIETHTGITENFDFIELEFGYPANIHVIEGSYDPWKELLTFVDTTGDLSTDADFNLVKEMVDLDNFTDYWITEVFAGNYDWLSNNIKFWKPENGKWEWFYWDTDHGLGLVYSDKGEVEWNTLNWSLTFSDRAWANGYNNILIRNLLENEDYRELFIKRFTQLLSTSFSTERTLPLLDSMRQLYQADMEIHARQWDRSMANWEIAIQRVADYLQRRPGIVLGHLQEFFGLPDPVPVSIRIEPPGAGTVSFSGMKISDTPLTGKFFPEMSYQLRFVPVPGYELDQWLPFQEKFDPIEFQLADSINIVAFALPVDRSFPIQICEVYTNNRNAYDPGDWIEFYYFGSDTADLEGWTIWGDDDQLLYTFDEDAIFNPGARFIVAENLDRFRKVFLSPIRGFGNMVHEMSDGVVLRLKSDTGEPVKTIPFMNSPHWPVLPDEGYSVELHGLVDDPSDGANWELSADRFGSPGLPNQSTYQFQPPSGKDTLCSNSKTHLLDLYSSEEFYYDTDGHGMAGISVKSISGPGDIYLGSEKVEESKIYAPGDLTYQPRGPLNASTSFIYSFIDNSGQESPDHVIRFGPLTGATRPQREEIHIYPVPSHDFCQFEIPRDLTGPIHFYLIDLQGKILQSLHTDVTEGNFIVDLTRVESGFYFYLIETGQSIINGKLEVIK
jgi:hypothetical protein